VNHEDDKLHQGADTPDDQLPDNEDSAFGKRGLRALFAHRWAFPALYLTAAALIIGLMYFQANRFTGLGHNTAVATPPATAQPTPASVTVSTGNWIWPVASDAKGVELVRGYYDKNAPGATVASLAKDLVHFGNTYSGSTGYDFGVPGGKQSFEVVAATAGVVENVHKSPVMGESVALRDGNGYATVYESLGSVAVKPGETVAQGQEIGTSGTNMMEANLGSHLYFQVDHSGALVDPGSMLPKTVA